MNSFIETIEKEFEALSKKLFENLKNGEELALNLYGEESAFVRFNAAKVRQNTHVWQKNVEAEFHFCGKTFKFAFPLTGDAKTDHEFALGELDLARREANEIASDPYQIAMENRGSSREVFPGELLPLEEISQKICTLTEGNDFVGLYSGGPVVVGNANSKGQKHFFATACFSMDYSVFDGPRAVKGIYAGSIWNEQQFRKSVSDSSKKLDLLKRPQCEVKKGTYRTYMAPAAVGALLDMFSWNGISKANYERGQSALQKFIEGEISLSEKFSLCENFTMGGTPRFNAIGEVAEPKISLIEKGKLKNLLISSRSAKEFGGISNAADASETLRSPEILAGDLGEAEILQRLGTGLYLSNLHYLNWSDRMGARVTGMTRYACFWVEKGEIIGPIKDMRFDESIFRIFGAELEAVTQHREALVNTSTYERRQLGIQLVPGILLKDFTFTL